MRIACVSHRCAAEFSAGTTRSRSAEVLRSGGLTLPQQLDLRRDDSQAIDVKDCLTPWRSYRVAMSIDPLLVVSVLQVDLEPPAVGSVIEAPDVVDGPPVVFLG